jgi:ORF6N domain
MTDRAENAMTLELIAVPAIQKRILVVRDRQVMLDEDLADLYGVETRQLISRSSGTSNASQPTSCSS